jgi:putative transposase
MVERNKGDDMEATNKVKVPHSHDELRNQSSADDKKVPQLKNYSLNNEIHKKEIFLPIIEVRNLLGITDRAIRKNCKNNKYQYYIDKSPNKKGGETYYISLSSLPVDAQEKYWESLAREDLKEAEKKAGDDPIANRIIAKHKLENEIEESKTIVDTLPEKAEKSIIIKAIESDKVKTKLEIIKEAIAVPAGWKVKEWQTAVAVKHKITYSTLRRWIEKMDKGGVALLVHQNTAKEKIFRWSQEGIEALRGLYLKRAHRKMSKKQIYKLLKEDASRKGYVIGSYSSALTYLRQFEKENDLLLKYRDQGIRGLDNHLPPIRRKYEDLDPFEIIVGDQHRFDFWVVDEETGKRFRPEWVRLSGWESKYLVWQKLPTLTMAVPKQANIFLKKRHLWTLSG